MSNVLDQAQNFSGGVIAAARQRDRWARREANATDDETREQYREAIADLTARYPDLEQIPIGGAEAFARERGHGAGSRSPVHEGRRRSRAGAAMSKASGSGRPKEKRKAAAPPKPRPAARPRAGRSSGGSPTPRVDRAISQTGIPAAAAGTGSLIMAALGATVGVSLLYLLLESAEKPGSGAAALPRMIGAVISLLHRIVSLQDVFPGAPAAAASSSGSPSLGHGTAPGVKWNARKGNLGRQKTAREGYELLWGQAPPPGPPPWPKPSRRERTHR